MLNANIRVHRCFRDLYLYNKYCNIKHRWDCWKKDCKAICIFLVWCFRLRTAASITGSVWTKQDAILENAKVWLLICVQYFPGHKKMFRNILQKKQNDLACLFCISIHMHGSLRERYFKIKFTSWNVYEYVQRKTMKAYDRVPVWYFLLGIAVSITIRVWTKPATILRKC